MPKLGWCPMCKEHSTYVDCCGAKRTEYCCNAGCEYSQRLPDLCLKRSRVSGESKDSEE